MASVPSDVPLHKRGEYPSELKRHILERCWGVVLSEAQFRNAAEQYRPYFKHYQTLCQNCSINNISRLTHTHLLQAIDYMKIRSFQDCETELESILKQFNDPYWTPRDVKACVIQWIRHAGKALLLLDLESWKGSETLEQYLLNTHFARSAQDDAYRIAISLNLRNLSEIGGLKIRWTSLLSEHLALERDDTQIAVFHHTHILDMLESSNIYPPHIIKEVKLTFGILLPRDDAKSRVWFRKQVLNQGRRAPGSSTELDPSFEAGKSLMPGDRNIQKLDYFRDRMICVKDLYDNHEPQTFMQHCRDSRRPARRWGFFIAVLLFVFGTGQLIEGAIQCYKSYYPPS